VAGSLVSFFPYGRPELAVILLCGKEAAEILIQVVDLDTASGQRWSCRHQLLKSLGGLD